MKNAKGLALTELIQRILNDDKIFTFSEFLFHPNVQASQNHDIVKLLKLFCYGTINENTFRCIPFLIFICY